MGVVGGAGARAVSGTRCLLLRQNLLFLTPAVFSIVTFKKQPDKFVKMNERRKLDQIALSRHFCNFQTYVFATLAGSSHLWGEGTQFSHKTVKPKIVRIL